MNPYNLNPGSDSLHYLHMAEKLLTNRDLPGSKSFAIKARESDPTSEAAEQILAIVDTLIAGEKQVSGNKLDWYRILQVASRSHDSEVIAFQYKKLGVLLNPNRNKFPFAEHAYKLVTEAWLVLSNPSRKFQFDNLFGNSNATHFNFVSEMQQQGRNKEDFLQDGSGGELDQHSNSMQFVQQAMSEQLHWGNQDKQILVRPQPQQNWFQHPDPQSPPYTLQLQVPQSRQHWAHNVPQPQPQSWMQEPLPRPHIQQSLTELLTQTRPPRESQQQLEQSLHLSQPPPRPPVESPEQPLHLPQTVPWPLPESREQPQQPMHSSQPVPQVPPLLQPQPWMQRSLPTPQIQTSSPELHSQPEKTPPESREWVNNHQQINFGENGNNAVNHEHNVNLEELPNFWTVCPYCFTMHEYPGIYADSALRCQNCKKVFHAAKTESPPTVADGEDAYLFCWGYFPIGISMSYLEKRKTEASSWQPFSKMFVIPRGGNTSPSPQEGTEFAFPQGGNTSKARNPRYSGPRIYVDDDDEEDIFDGISSNDESDDEDWGYTRKNKKARRCTRKVSTATKVKQPQVSPEMVQDSNTRNLRSGVLAQDGSDVSVPDAAVQIVAETAELIVPEMALPSFPVPKAAMDDADKEVLETSKKKVSVPIRKQPSRVAKDLLKLDGVVAQEGSGVGVPEAAEVSFSLADQPNDCGKLDGVDRVDVVVAEKRSGVSVPEGAEVSATARKQPSRVAKDSGKLDGVIAQEGLDVPEAESDKNVMGENEKKAVGGSNKKRVSVPTRKQPGRVAKDLESSI